MPAESTGTIPITLAAGGNTHQIRWSLKSVARRAGFSRLTPDSVNDRLKQIGFWEYLRRIDGKDPGIGTI
jgi:hypothetical protein